MIDEQYIANWFTYHAPTKDQTTVYEAIRAHGREFAFVINNLVPDGQDKIEALNKLREAVMWANAAVATDTEAAPVAPVRRAEDTHRVGFRSPYQTSAWPSPVTAVPVAPKHRAEPQTIEEMVEGFVASKVGA